VKSYSFVLNSTQTLVNPVLINGYMFLDPVYGYSYTPQLTDIGGDFTGTTSYPDSANAGLFYPWGYSKQDSITTLSAGNLKGPYTITFSPSGLDTSGYALLKIVYDFGDGTGFSTDNSIIYSVKGAGGNGITDSTKQVVTHDYWPTNNYITTYTPTVTVLNGNLALNIFNISFSLVPISLFELDNISIINTAQHSSSIEETLGVFEVKGINTVTNARYFSAGTTDYNNNTNTILGDFNEINGLIINLDASDSFTVIKDSSNKVTLWKDKSSYGNDFVQSDYALAPTFLYPKQSELGRKSVRFSTSNPLSLASYLSCVNPTGFSSTSGGYTAFIIAAVNDDSGTLFYGGSSQDVGANLIINVTPEYNITTYQGYTSAYVPTVSRILPIYSLYTVTADTSGAMTVTYDTQKYNFKGLNTQFGALTSTASISRPYGSQEFTSLLDTEVSQVLIYNRILNSDEYNVVCNTLINNWSLTLQSA